MTWCTATNLMQLTTPANHSELQWVSWHIVANHSDYHCTSLKSWFLVVGYPHLVIFYQTPMAQNEMAFYVLMSLQFFWSGSVMPTVTSHVSDFLFFTGWESVHPVCITPGKFCSFLHCWNSGGGECPGNYYWFSIFVILILFYSFSRRYFYMHRLLLLSAAVHVCRGRYTNLVDWLIDWLIDWNDVIKGVVSRDFAWCMFAHQGVKAAANDPPPRCVLVNSSFDTWEWSRVESVSQSDPPLTWGTQNYYYFYCYSAQVPLFKHWPYWWRCSVTAFQFRNNSTTLCDSCFWRLKNTHTYLLTYLLTYFSHLS